MNYGGVKLGDLDPFVGVETETIVYGGKRCVLKRVTIQGKITPTTKSSCKNSLLSDINTFQTTVLTDYQTLEVGGITLKNARCESLSVSNVTDFGGEYSAEFIAYPEEFFTTIVGVLEPVDSISVIENTNGTTSILRRISGRGISNTSPGTAIDKVLNWISTLNLDTPPINKLGSNFGITVSNTLKPKSFRQVIDRINASVNIDIDYEFNTGGSSSSVLAINIESSKNDTGLTSVNVDGSLTGPTDILFSDLKKEFTDIPFFTYAQSITTTAISDNPVNFNVVENHAENTISFSYTYDELSSDKLIISETTIEHDVVSDIRTININGTASFQKKHQKDRKTDLNKLFDPKELRTAAESEYNKFFNQQPPSFQIPDNYSYSTNNSSYTINFNASYSDNNKLKKDSKLANLVYSLDYSITYTPSLNIRYPLNLMKKALGFKTMDIKSKTRSRYSIKGSAFSFKDAIQDEIIKEVELILDNSMASLNPNNINLENIYITSSQIPDNKYEYIFLIEKTAETGPIGK